MRFLLYNIRYAAGTGRQFHLPVPYSGYFKHTNGNLKKIVEFIGSVNPDIIGLVEVDSGSFRSEKNNQADAIAWELQHSSIYQSKYCASSVARKVPVLNKQGNAILNWSWRKFQSFWCICPLSSAIATASCRIFIPWSKR